MHDFTISALSIENKGALLHKINHKTKPQGALGTLELLALQIGLVQNTLSPQLTRPCMLVFAADHGIASIGVSPYPQSVTAQMVRNFLNGGAAINVFTKQHHFELCVIDAGVNDRFEANTNLIDAKISLGTANFLYEPAMTRVQCLEAISRGAKITMSEINKGSNILAFGEMGIGNTASASCLMSVLCKLPIEQCVGRGAGLDDEGLQRKIAILKQAINHHALQDDDPFKALITFGGFEINMIVGGMLMAAERGVLIIIDGFITTAALLVAVKIQPNIIDYCIFAHCSDESGHRLMLQYLNAEPLLNLGLRLGEGSGAVLAYPLIVSAVGFLNEMASFESAGVSEKT